MQSVEKGLCRLQIGSIKPFGKAVTDELQNRLRGPDRAAAGQGSSRRAVPRTGHPARRAQRMRQKQIMARAIMVVIL